MKTNLELVKEISKYLKVISKQRKVTIIFLVTYT